MAGGRKYRVVANTRYIITMRTPMNDADRALPHRGSTIGYHLQDFDEVYYILSGTGEYTLNGTRRQVGPGTAMLTRPGDSHGLRPTGDGELVLIIAYPAPAQ
jgi:mannose-6-phosphate isomerase-like protein (cupin superfamily)